MNWKKGIGFFLALLILVSNVGFAFTMHYCGGKVASVSVKTFESHSNNEKGCCEGKELTKDSCCKNKTVHLEKKTDNATLKAFSFESFSGFLVTECKIVIVSLQPTFIASPIAAYFCDAHSPPLFKLYHQFLFYA
ncbi:MAG: hypothetical protein RLZZ44_457 [Bacteroidota bacterium]